MDKPDEVISLINLATVRSLEAQWGIKIDPLRFRANLYIDGAGPWEEFDWVGSDIRIGDALFRVDRRNGRCGATNVDPETGRRDLDIPGSLRAAFGHKELGVYLTTREGGSISVGDSVVTPAPMETDIIARPPVYVRRPTRKTFICGGCYFIYEPSAGLPEQAIAPGTPFARDTTGHRGHAERLLVQPEHLRQHDVPTRVVVTPGRTAAGNEHTVDGVNSEAGVVHGVERRLGPEPLLGLLGVAPHEP